MNQKYNISDILDSVNEINNSKPFKKISLILNIFPNNIPNNIAIIAVEIGLLV